MCKRLLLVLLLAPVALFASDPWTRKDTIMEAAFLSELIVDWKQTSEFHRTFRQDGTCYREANEILGCLPSQKRINTYFLSAAILHVGVSMALPSTGRHRLQIISIVLEGLCINGNASAGVKIRW